MPEPPSRKKDFKRCVDYIHWNPKKHGLMANVRDWPWSSFHGFVAMGEYTLDWGAEDPTPGYNDPEWGEQGVASPATERMRCIGDWWGSLRSTHPTDSGTAS